MITKQQVKNLTLALLQSSRATKWDHKLHKIVLTDYYYNIIDELNKNAEFNEMLRADFFEKIKEITSND